ncbi:MAG: hypothetical protein RI935_646 [Candidatus Parcubacteria bacterium]|jgi:hypothetical protein
MSATENKDSIVKTVAKGVGVLVAILIIIFGGGYLIALLFNMLGIPVQALSSAVGGLSNFINDLALAGSAFVLSGINLVLRILVPALLASFVILLLIDAWKEWRKEKAGGGAHGAHH